MQHHGLTDQQRDRIRQHRKYCLSFVKPISTLEKLDVTEIARAAKAAQERMGLSQLGGAAFKLKNREKNNRLAVHCGRSPDGSNKRSGVRNTS